MTFDAFILAYCTIASTISLIIAIVAIIKVEAMARSTHTIQWKPLESTEEELAFSDKNFNDKLQKSIEENELALEKLNDEVDDPLRFMKSR